MSSVRMKWLCSLLLCVVCSTSSSAALADAIDNLAAGQWYAVPNSQLRSVLPSPVPAGDPRNVIDAWSGATFDTAHNRLLLWGGGHSDYAGNELYAFSLNTLTWTRLTNPSADTGGDESTGTYPDGNPRSGHSYDMLAYAPNVDRMFIMGLSAVWVGGGTPRNFFAYDFPSSSWKQIAQSPSLGDTKGGATTYDSATGTVWYHSSANSPLTQYDPNANTWKSYGSPQYFQLYSTAAIDPIRRILLFAGGYDQRQIFAFDLNNPSNAPAVPNTSGPRDIENDHAPGFDFDLVSKKFVGWDGGTSVAVLDPSNWSWQRIPAASTNTVAPGAPSPQGTYGRFRYVPSRNVFVLVNSIDQNVFIYKLSTAAPTTQPAITLNASPGTVQAQGSTTLTWSATNADNCTASGGWTGSKGTSGSLSIASIAATTTYTLGCTNAGGGSASTSVTVTVPGSTPKPTVSLQASPTSVSSGGTTTLSWSSQNATGCIASGAWAGNQASSGTMQSATLAADSTFTLQCSGAGGSTNAAVTVTVSGSTPSTPAPTAKLAASATSVAANGAVTLTWSSQNATACAAGGAWSGTKAVSGSEAQGPLSTGSSSFQLMCTGAGGSVAQSVTVEVASATTSSATAPTTGGGGALGLSTAIPLLLGLLVRLRRSIRTAVARSGRSL